MQAGDEKDAVKLRKQEHSCCLTLGGRKRNRRCIALRVNFIAVEVRGGIDYAECAG